MQYIYFGLIPFLTAGWLVWREYYAPMAKSTWAQTLTYLIFLIIYSVRFNILVGLIATLFVFVIFMVWSMAVKNDRSKNLKG